MFVLVSKVGLPRAVLLGLRLRGWGTAAAANWVSWIRGRQTWWEPGRGAPPPRPPAQALRAAALARAAPRRPASCRRHTNYCAAPTGPSRLTRQGMRPVTGMPSAPSSVSLRGLLVINWIDLTPISCRMCATARAWEGTGNALARPPRERRHAQHAAAPTRHRGGGQSTRDPPRSSARRAAPTCRVLAAVVGQAQRAVGIHCV